MRVCSFQKQKNKITILLVFVFFPLDKDLNNLKSKICYVKHGIKATGNIYLLPIWLTFVIYL